MTWPMLGIAAAIGFALFIASAWRLESPRWAKISALGGWILAVAIGAYQCQQDSRQTSMPALTRDGLSDEPEPPDRKRRLSIFLLAFVSFVAGAVCGEIIRRLFGRG
jgi:uncharacterized membrane protein